ncbi:MAG TPA: ATP-grasp domain-containing protein [Pirellulales bacterium]|nr:ATP-grasp domain-containing protein [Pirellulales bacterium]
MRIFVYEFVTDGGWSKFYGQSPPPSLAAEGRAMRDAVAQDFAAIPGTQVLGLDEAGAAEQPAFQAAAREADFTLIIAPEFDGLLATRHRWAEAAGARVLGGDRAAVELAADKHRTAAHLARSGLPVPVGRLLDTGDPLPADFPYPAVLKPVAGAGSLGIRWIDEPGRLPVLPAAGGRWRLERFCAGMAASVVLLCGPAGIEALPACRQRLADPARFPDEPFAYRGGECPLPAPFDERARRLAQRAVQSLATVPARPLGWLGVDLVLGADPGGADDVVIEINPRLTTSYVGLRRLAEGNLAAALLAAVRGEPVRLSFRPGPLQFAPDGATQYGHAEAGARVQ